MSTIVCRRFSVAVGAVRFGAPFPHEGRAYVYLGSPAGLAASPSWTYDGTSMGLGGQMAAAGDVDADGFDDLLVSEASYDKSTFTSAVYLFLGSANGPAADPAWRVAGGSFVGGADVDGDGIDDVLKRGFLPSWPAGVGGLLLYRGSPSGLSQAPYWTVRSAEPGDAFGASPALLDTNGDGLADLAAGAYSFDRCSGIGRPYVFSGCNAPDCGYGARSYCDALPTSLDFGARMGFVGSLEVARNDFHLTAGCVPQQLGLFFYGAGVTQAPLGDGLLCVAPGPAGIFRLGPPLLPSGNVARRHVDLLAPPASIGAGQVLGGSTWYFQYWFPDSAGTGGGGSNLSDGLAVTFR